MAFDSAERFVERAALSGRVDREAGVIRDVKILGMVSKNGREYPANVLRKAVALYEGKAVNVAHVRAAESRNYADRIGRLVGVRFVEGDGLRGDLHINPQHALAAQLLWDAEHAPQNVGLSHDATGKSVRRGQLVIVEAIESVRSVDIVADPATTGGLFEDTGGGDFGPRYGYGGVKTWGDDPTPTGRVAEGEVPCEERAWRDEPEREPERNGALAEAYRKERVAEQQATIKRWTDED